MSTSPSSCFHVYGRARCTDMCAHSGRRVNELTGLLCGLAIAISLVLCVALLRGELVVLVFCGGHGVVGCGGEEGWRGT